MTTETESSPQQQSPAATPTPTARRLAAGSVVNYVLPKTSPSRGQVRIATIVRTNGTSTVVALSVAKGLPEDFKGVVCGIQSDNGTNVLLGAVAYSDAKKGNTWHWPD